MMDRLIEQNWYIMQDVNDKFTFEESVSLMKEIFADGAE